MVDDVFGRCGDAWWDYGAEGVESLPPLPFWCSFFQPCCSGSDESVSICKRPDSSEPGIHYEQNY